MAEPRKSDIKIFRRLFKYYKCLKCGYLGEDFLFRGKIRTHAIAKGTLAYGKINFSHQWIQYKHEKEAKLTDPILCIRCRAWGVRHFIAVKRLPERWTHSNRKQPRRSKNRSRSSEDSFTRR